MQYIIDFTNNTVTAGKNILKAESDHELLSYVIPEYFGHVDFVALEKIYLQNKISGLDIWLSVQDYMRANGLKTRKSVYDRIKQNKLLVQKINGFTFVKDK